LIDVEYCINQAMRQAFSTNDHKVEIKECWFHFCQAILKQVNNIGGKEAYQNHFKFRSWIKRFMALAIIPIENLQDSLNIIIEEMSDKPGPNTILEYYIKPMV
jgi:hypothetical protein